MAEKIALFLPKLGGGGAERVMLNLACGFVDQGHPVDLVLSFAEGQYLAELDSRVRLIDLDARRVAASVPALIRYLRSQKPSVMLSTQLHANLAALMAASVPGINTRIIVRETNSPVGEGFKSSSIWARFLDLAARICYRRADAVIVGCSDLKQQISEARSVPLEKISVIFNPVRVNDILQRAEEPSGHPWLDAPTAPVILSIGRLEEQKDFKSLILAFSKIRQQLDAKLVILGEGSLRGELTALAESSGLSEDIDLPGFVTNPYPYISRADMFVLSSLWEGSPNVLLEALTLGTPIVSTDCQTGPREILRGGKDGILVPIRDPNLLAEGILNSVKTKKRTPAPPESLHRFDSESVVNQYLEVLKVNN